MYGNEATSRTKTSHNDNRYNNRVVRECDKIKKSLSLNPELLNDVWQFKSNLELPPNFIQAQTSLFREKDNGKMLGVYTLKFIACGTPLAFYKGIRYTAEEWTELEQRITGSCESKCSDTISQRLDYAVDVENTGTVIDGWFLNNASWSRYINSSFMDERASTQNTIFIDILFKGEPHVLLIAIRDIQPFTELLTWYGDNFQYKRDKRKRNLTTSQELQKKFSSPLFEKKEEREDGGRTTTESTNSTTTTNDGQQQRNDPSTNLSKEKESNEERIQIISRTPLAEAKEKTI